MLSTQRHLFQHTDLEGAAKALGTYETPFDGYLRVIYTCQQNAAWTYCIGQCVLGRQGGEEKKEVYPGYAFVTRTLYGITLRKFIESLTGETGIEAAPDFPPLRLAGPHPNWREEIVPGHVTASGMPSRRFRASVEKNAVFSDAQLIDFDLPYRASAAQYVKTLLGLKPGDSVEGGRGEFTIDIPDMRGAISLSHDRLSIAHATVPLRLVGEIDGSPVDLRNDGAIEIDDKNIRNVELWLLTKGSELVDYISTTHWPYKYPATPQEAAREEALLTLIRGGESEVCEFKPSVDLANEKAFQLEKSVCAFSNQKGGTLFIGVNKEGDIEGVASHAVRRGDDPDAAIAAYAHAVRLRLREALKDNQCFEVSVSKVADTSLVVVTVAKSNEINFLIKTKTAHIRHGGSSMKLTAQEMKTMVEASLIQNRMF
ncbi:MAG: ATP-binding protein [Gammaproteobacteria bacterium]